jgi:hypothetical protein
MIEQFLVGDLQHSYYTLYVPQTLIRSLYRVIVFMMGWNQNVYCSCNDMLRFLRHNYIFHAITICSN